MRRRSQAAGLLAAPGPAAGAAALGLGPEVHRLSLATDAHAPGLAGAGSILVVESDAPLARALVEQLLADGYRAEPARSAEHARMLARACPPQLIVLGEVGSARGAMELLREIRTTAGGSALWARRMPVIVLGASESELDMLRAFEAGTDDFMARPARYLELRARMRALLRRAQWTIAPARRLTVGALQIDLDQHAVSLHGLPVDLRRLEFELLVHLAGDPERVFSKQELLRVVWGYRSTGSTRTLDSHASRLRRKLQQRGGGRWVINVWGVGYRLR